MTKWTISSALPALAVVGMSLSVTACSETAIVGSVLDEDVATGDETIQMALARGSNSEVADIMTVGRGYKHTLLAATDDILNDGVSAAEDRWSAGNWDWNSTDTEAMFEQAMEGSWSGLKLVNNLVQSLPEDSFQISPLVARGYLNSAHSERLLGDMFCQLAYGFDHTGGRDLDNLGSSSFDNAPVGKDSTFKRMATFAELAVAYAQRAVDAEVPNPANEGVLSDGHFDPQRILTASHGAAAQAYHALASLGVDPNVNWPLAAQHAAEVPTDFVEVTIFDPTVEQNELWDTTFDDDDVTLYSAADASRPAGFLGVPATFLWLDDPRVQVVDCADSAPIYCRWRSRGSEGPDEFPRWVPLKYQEQGSDDEMVTGTEMRLIEAEEALVHRADFGTFYNKIDEVRMFYAAEAGTVFVPTERLMVMGEVEWPNAEDDAMSILDRERYLTMWMEGRRMFDLYRWNHPFITNNEALIQRHDDVIAVLGPRNDCAPIPGTECLINTKVPCQ
jgi:hypothetical protein